MSLVAVIFVFWVLYSAYRGYRRGLWFGLFSLFAFIAAYAASFIWGPSLGVVIKGYGVGTVLAYAMGYFLSYSLVYIAVGLLPRWIFAGQLTQLSSQPWPGALLGGVVGGVSGLVFVWAFSFLQVALNFSPSGMHSDAYSAEPASAVKDSEQPLTEVKQPSETAVLQEVAATLMGEASRWGARAAGVDALQADIVGTMVAAPQQSLRDMQALSRSAELKAFLVDQSVQAQLQANNLDALIESEPFQSLIHLPELSQLRQLALQEVQSRDGRAESGLREADMYIAGRLSTAWRRMEALADDPIVQEIMQDQNIKVLVEKQDIPGLLGNSKVRSLLGLVLEGEVDGVELNHALERTPRDESGDVQSHNADASLGESKPSLESVPANVYKWRDSHGQVRYSDKPPSNVDAELIQH